MNVCSCKLDTMQLTYRKKCRRIWLVVPCQTPWAGHKTVIFTNNVTS